MPLPNEGAISTTQIMQELGVAVQARDWASLWALARVDSIPKNVANAGGPYRLPNDWYGYSNVPPIDNIPPNPFSMFAGASTMFENAMTWEMNGDNVGVIGYRVFRNNNQITTLGVVGSYSDTGLTPGTSYTYYVQAFDAAGNVRDCAAISISTLPDTIPPAHFTLTPGISTHTSNSFSWTFSSDNVGITEYDVYANDSYLTTVSNTTNSFVHNFIIPDALWSYFIKAIDGARNKTDSNIIFMQYSTSSVTLDPGSGIANKLASGSNVTFSAARNPPNPIIVNNTPPPFVNCSLITGTYACVRICCGYDVSAISGATSANLLINIVANALLAPKTFAVTLMTVQHPANYVFSNINFNECLGTGVSTFNVNNGQTGSISIPLSTTIINQINSGSSISLSIVQHTNDYSNVAPSSTATGQSITIENGFATKLQITY